LILTYNYPEKRIKQFVPMQMGAETKEADIIVYDDAACETPLIVVECKKEEVTEQEFNAAVEQAYSYANSGNVRAKYVWVTSRLKNKYYEELPKKPVVRKEITDIPHFGQTELLPYKYLSNRRKNNFRRSKVFKKGQIY
jgi:type I restriction enzyme M protein